MPCTYYKNMKTRSSILLITLFFITSNLFSESFFFKEGGIKRVDHSFDLWYGDVNYIQGPSTLTVYRIENKDITLTTNEDITGYYEEDYPWGVPLDQAWLGFEKKNSPITWGWINKRRSTNSQNYTILDSYNNFGYSWLPFTSRGLNMTLKANFVLGIPSHVKDGSYSLGSYYVTNTSTATARTKTTISNYQVTIITIPSFTVIESSIDFGRIPTDTTIEQKAFGKIKFMINNPANRNATFTATYPKTVNMINSKDNSVVPLNIKLLKGSKTGIPLETNFQLSSDTDIYVKATLPPSSITNKSTGIYSGSLRITIDYN